jgi:uncharacterized protein (DUF1501 family)
MDRRQFIKTSACVASSLCLKLGALPLMAEETSGYRAIVVINLEGGNDGNSMLLPLDSSSYQYYSQARGSAAIAQSSLIPLPTSSGSFGINPSLAPLSSLFSEGKLAFVANVGNLTVPIDRAGYLSGGVPIPPNVCGHDGGQVMFQTANMQGAAPYGWGGLIADTFGSSALVSPVISVGGSSVFAMGSSVHPVTFAGPQIPHLLGFDNSNASAARLAALEAIASTPTGSTLEDAANAVFVHAEAQSKALSNAISSLPPLQTQFPNSTLGSQLKMVTSIMQARDALGASRHIFYCTTGGFDLHSSIHTLEPALLDNLAQCLVSFQRALTEIGTNGDVLTLTMSEFARTLQLNNNFGADHGWGSHHIVMGDPVKGGKIYGTYPSLQLSGPDDCGSIGVWIPTTSVSQYVSPAAAWLGVGGDKMGQVFPLLGNFPSGPLTYLG